MEWMDAVNLALALAFPFFSLPWVGSPVRGSGLRLGKSSLGRLGVFFWARAHHNHPSSYYSNTQVRPRPYRMSQDVK